MRSRQSRPDSRHHPIRWAVPQNRSPVNKTHGPSGNRGRILSKSPFCTRHPIAPLVRRTRRATEGQYHAAEQAQSSLRIEAAKKLLTREIAGLIPEGIVNAELYGTGVFSAIGVLHEEGHREPWIIAMNAAPSRPALKREHRDRRAFRAPFFRRVARQGSRLWDALEHRSNVLRLQNPGLWHHPKPDQKAGSIGAAHTGSGNRCVPGRLRSTKRTGLQPGQKKNTLSRNAAKKGGPESSTIPVFPLQGRPAHHPAVSRGLCQNTQVIATTASGPGGVDKLKGGKQGASKNCPVSGAVLYFGYRPGMGARRWRRWFFLIFQTVTRAWTPGAIRWSRSTLLCCGGISPDP